MTPATTPDTELTPDLIERVLRLSDENRLRLIGRLGGEPPIPEPPPVGDWAFWKAEIVRRIEAVENGTMKTYTLQEAMAKIRAVREARST